MKRILLFLLTLMFVLISCKQDFLLVIKKEPGAITGKVYPDTVVSMVTLSQGSFKSKQLTDPDGYFYFGDVKIGIYKIKAEAVNFGSVVMEDVKVEESATTDVGLLRLSDIPYPLMYVDPRDGEKYVSVDQRIGFQFSENIDQDSFERSFSISPYEALNQFGYQYSSYSSMVAYMYADLDFDTEYEIRLDKTLMTTSGEYIDFPFSSTFRTDQFRITDLYFNNSSYYGSGVILRFNGSLKTGLGYDPYITITPAHDLDVSSSGTSISIKPDICWQSDTYYEMNILKGIQSKKGPEIESDTSFTFYTDKFDIVNTNPYHGKHYVNRNTVIDIYFNYVIDESTIENAITVQPEFTYQIHSSRSNYYSQIELNPDSLSANTKYTITIDGSVKDFYGKSLYSGHTFYFVTDSI